ncbi:MAG: hypothetical protein GY731_07355 [Gammaproteobacteria bacterium]|nr:hypothetical protein [Gammaproteobacteria bacterium]
MAENEKPDSEAVDAPSKKKPAAKNKPATKKKITVKKSAAAPAKATKPEPKSSPAPVKSKQEVKQEKIRQKAASMGVMPKKKPAPAPVAEPPTGGLGGVIALWLPLVIIGGLVMVTSDKKSERSVVAKAPSAVETAAKTTMAAKSPVAAPAPIVVAAPPAPAPEAKVPVAAQKAPEKQAPVAELPAPDLVTAPALPTDPFAPIGKGPEMAAKMEPLAPPPPPPPPSWEQSLPATPAQMPPSAAVPSAPGTMRAPVHMGSMPQMAPPELSAPPSMPTYPTPTMQSQAPQASVPEQVGAIPAPEYANPLAPPGYRSGSYQQGGYWGPYGNRYQQYRQPYYNPNSYPYYNR